jgi:hypothetical protein
MHAGGRSEGAETQGDIDAGRLQAAMYLASASGPIVPSIYSIRLVSVDFRPA